MENSKPETAKKRRLSDLTANKHLFWGITAILVLIALITGVPYYRYLISHESTDDAFIEGHIVPISSQLAGYVEDVSVTDNQKVEAGDLLLRIDARDFQARLDAARAQLQAATAACQSYGIKADMTVITAGSSLDEAKAAVRAARAAVAGAKAELNSAQATLAQVQAEVSSPAAAHKRDKEDMKRFQKMLKSEAIARQRLDHAVAAERMSASGLAAAQKKVETQKAVVRRKEADLKGAKDELLQAKARLAAARSAPREIAYSRSQLEMAKADVIKAKAQVEQAELDLSHTKLYAPCSGYVTRKTVEAGGYVQAGQSLLTIVPRDVWVLANFKETQLTRIRPGQPVKINVDTYPDVTFKGQVDSIQCGSGARFSLLPPENATGNYVKVVQRVPVKIVFNDKQQMERYLLAPGMSVVPEVDVADAGRAAIPPEKTAAAP